MAGESRSKSSASSQTPGGSRAFPVLVPQGALAGQADIPLDRPVTTVGSNENARLHLVSRTVSKGHAIFVNNGAGTYVADLASRTGVLLNGKLVKEASLKNGDRVQIGKFVFRYRSASGAPTAAPAVAPAAAVIVVGWPAMPITSNVVQIGRRENSDIALADDTSVSAAHAVIFQMNGNWYIRDVGSRTGTTVNGKTIHQQMLNFGDRVNIGSSTILFQPGASVVTPVDESDVHSSDTAVELQPLNEVDEVESTVVTVSDDEETVLPGSVDWRSAFPLPSEHAVDESLEELTEEVASDDSTQEEPLDELIEEDSAEEEVIAPATPEPEAVIIPEVMDKLDIATEPLEVVESPAETEPAETEVVLQEAEPVDDRVSAVSSGSVAAMNDGHAEIGLDTALVETSTTASIEEKIEPAADTSAANVRQEDQIGPPDFMLNGADVEVSSSEGSAITIESHPVAADVQAIADSEAHSESSAAESAAAPVALPVTSLARAAVAPVDLVADVDDFVFLPGEESADATAIPEVLFWGDEEPDLVSEQAVAPTSIAAQLVMPEFLRNSADADSIPEADRPPAVKRSNEISAAGESVGEQAFVSEPTVEPIQDEASPDLQGTHPEISVGEEQAEIPVSKPVEAITSDQPVVVPPAIADGLELAVISLDQPVVETAASESPLAETTERVQVVETGEHISVEAFATEPVAVDSTSPMASVLTVDEVEPDISKDSTSTGEVPEISTEMHPIEPVTVEAFATEPVSIDSTSPIGSVLTVDEVEKDVSEDLTTTGEVPEISTEIQPIEPAAAEAFQTEPVAVNSVEATAAPLPDVVDAEPAVPAPVEDIGITAVNAEPTADESTATEALEIVPPLDFADIDFAEREAELFLANEIEPLAASTAEHEHLTDVTETAPLLLSEERSVASTDVAGLLKTTSGIVETVSSDATKLEVETFAANVPTSESFAEPAISTAASLEADPNTSIFDFDRSAVQAEAPIPAESAAEDFAATFAQARQQLEQPESSAGIGQPAIDAFRVNEESTADFNEVEGIESETPQTTQGIEELTAVEDQFESVPIESQEAHEPEYIEPEPELVDSTDAVDWSALSTQDELSAGENIAHTTALIEPAAEPENLEFLEPESDLAEPLDTTEWSGVSTVDEISGGGTIAHTVPVTDPEVAEADDLEFLDFTEPPAETPAGETPVEVSPKPLPAEVPPVEVELVAETSVALPSGKTKPKGPPLFGFEFEGGSFLGGMPLPLNVPVPVVPQVTPPVVAKSTAFNMLSTAPSGLEAMAAAPVSPIARRSTAPPPGMPPQPGNHNAPANPVSLSGLVSEARVPWASGPIIPPTTPPVVGRTRPATPAKPLTSTFNLPGATPRTAEVFSQMSAPIGVEVFGGRPGNPDQFVVPDIAETIGEMSVTAAAAQRDEVSKTAPPATPAYQPGRKARRSRIPMLLVLLLCMPGLIWLLAYHLLPVSSQIVGSITYSGLDRQSELTLHDFIHAQEMRIYGDDVRATAMAILQQQNKPVGFLADHDQYTPIVDKQYLNWNRNSLEFTYNTTDPQSGQALVSAVLEALKKKDQDLEDARNQARADADVAKARLDALAAQDTKLSQDHIALARAAEEKPDGNLVAQADQEVTTLKQKWADASMLLNSNLTAFNELQNLDTSKPIDVDNDPEVVKLMKTMQQSKEQIRSIKNAGGANTNSATGMGTNVLLGATTQPDGAADPLLTLLQTQVDGLQKKLDDRKAELAGMQALGPAQRAVNQAREIENLSVKITGLRKDEADASIALNDAAKKARDYHARMDAANLADAEKRKIEVEMEQNKSERREAADVQTAKEAAFNSCVTVDGEPKLRNAVVLTDLRQPSFLLGSLLSTVLFGLMILGELRRPKLIYGVQPPAAAPLVNLPARVIPWPQPHELEGLKQAPVDVDQMLV